MKNFSKIGALLAWFGVVAQLYLHLVNSDLAFAEKIIRFFSYFTIQVNILAAVCYTCVAFRSSNFFSKATVLSATTVYIAVVGLVYNTVLRNVWDPQGLQLVVDQTLHTVNPLLFVGFWLFFVPKNSLSWGSIPGWLIYPLVYCIYVIIRGALSGFYPYPFMDVDKLGYGQVAINSLVVTGVFLFFASLFVGIGRMSKS